METQSKKTVNSQSSVNEQKTRCYVGIIGNPEKLKRSFISAITKYHAPKNVIAGDENENIEFESEKFHYVPVVISNKSCKCVEDLVCENAVANNIILVVSAVDDISSVVCDQLSLARQIGAQKVAVFLDKCYKVEDNLALNDFEHKIRKVLTKKGFDGKETPIVRGSSFGAVHEEETWKKKIDEFLVACDGYFDEPLDDSASEKNSESKVFKAIIYWGDKRNNFNVARCNGKKKRQNGVFAEFSAPTRIENIKLFKNTECKSYEVALVSLCKSENIKRNDTFKIICKNKIRYGFVIDPNPSITTINENNFLSGILDKISVTRPLFLFPIRLETSFRKREINGKIKKQLRVRIIPDEIMLNYKKDAKLTSEEVANGKFFWIQWFIASGCKKREKEAWDTLCSKYPSYKAAWICDSLRPEKFEDFREGEEYFYRRPYANYIGNESNLSGLDYIETKCQEVYRLFDGIMQDLNDIDSSKGDKETVFEKNVREKLGAINSFIFAIDSLLQPCEYIVDYLYENVQDTFGYIQKQLEVIDSVYSNQPNLKTSRSLELWDSDYSVLESLKNKVSKFLDSLENRYITLSDMVKKYLDEDKIPFPKVKIRSESSPIIPACSCLPEKFVLVAEAANENRDMIVAESKKVGDIQMFFDLSQTKTEECSLDDNTGELNVPKKMKWLTDYDVAVENGMAITVEDVGDIKEFRYIYVFGVKSKSESNTLRDLFYGHNYINSNVRILNAGTSTNLVEKDYVDEEGYLRDVRYKLEVEECGQFPKLYATLQEISQQQKDFIQDCKTYLSKDIADKAKDIFSAIEKNNDFEKINELENILYDLKNKIPKEKQSLLEKYNVFYKKIFDISDYDARKIAYLLKGGINKDCYEKDLLNCWARVIGYDSRQDESTRIAYTAIWNYFEKNKFVWGDKLFTADSTKEKEQNKFNNRRAFIKDFFINHVRARGNFPAIRVENMPYGILPISDFVQMCKLLKEGGAENENIAELLDVLISLANLWRKMRNKQAKWPEKLVGKKIQEKYLEMAGQTPYSLRDNCTGRISIDSPFNPSYLKIKNSNIRDSKKIDIEQLSIVRYLGQSFFKAIPIADVGSSDNKDGCQTIDKELELVEKEVLTALKGGDHTETGESSEDEAVKKNARIYVSEFLDLFTHRLDAWFLGIIDYWFNQKIRTIDAGVIGAFGWTFGLKEDEKKQTVENREQVIRDMEINKLSASEPILKAPSDAHFTIAPSIQHALTAAVLRSSYLKSKSSNDDEKNSQICVNLSSTRVRQALRLVDGVKSGMSLSIILGSDLERYLHESIKNFNVEMDEYIYPLRKYFPQTIKLEAQDERANDYVMEVINGEALLNSFIEKWDWNGSVSGWLNEEYNKKTLNSELPWLYEFKTQLNEEFGDEQQRDKIVNCLFKNIERLMDSYDALNDLLLSEGVHRLIMGDRASYYAISKYLASGDGGLPDMSILNIPSERVVVSHKAGVLLPQTIKNPDKVMCHAEPALNAWIEQQLGDMDRILVFAQIDEGKSVKTIHCSLKELNVSGIEYMYLSAYGNSFFAYLEGCLRKCMPEYSCANKISILESAPETYVYPEDKLSLEDDKLRIDAIRSLVARGHAMNAADWCDKVCDDKSEKDLIDVVDLRNRFSTSMAKLEILKGEIDGWLRKKTMFMKIFEKVEKTNENAVGINENVAALDDSTVMEGLGYLCSCFETGIINCLAESGSTIFVGDVTQTSYPLEYDKICIAQKDLGLRLFNAYKNLEERISQAKKIVETSQSVESFVSALQTITLNVFKICYKFKTSDVKNLFSTSRNDGALDKGVTYYDNVKDRMVFEQWQDEVSEVREGMKLLHQLHMAQMALDSDLDSVAILQTSIPDESECSDIDTKFKKWLGVAVDNEGELRNADSLVLYNSSAYKTDNGGGLSGFVFDSWIEYIPYKKHDAGIAFHNDWPDNEAPQALLVAWHPKLSVLKNAQGGNWNAATLLQVIRTTRFMMMNRAVEPDHIYGDDVLSKVFPLTPKSIYEVKNLDN